MGKKLNLTEEQKRIIEVKGRDTLVAASAGSGKTFVVVERIITRVIQDEIDIDKILVVTFTNAAASELKERIINRFYDFLKDKSTPENKKRHIQRQLSLINRAQISTIHSFCLNIIKNNFYILNIDANVKTLDENKAKLLLMDSIEEVLDEEYEKKEAIFENILELFKTEENVIDIIDKLYSFSRTMPDPSLWLEKSLNRYNIEENITDLSEIDFGASIIGIIKERLELVQNELENICSKIAGDKDFETRLAVLEDILDRVNTLKYFYKYDDMYKYLNCNMIFPRLPSSKCANEELKNEVALVKKKVVDELENVQKMVYKDTKGIIYELKSVYEIIKWFVDITKKLDKIYSDKKTTSGQIDFNDYEHLALKVLENDDICRQYIDKFTDIYIDEYQDTSYLQEIITSKISKNNRMMVGDVKQSIYSFRNAEPSIFNEKYSSYRKYDNLEDGNDAVKIVLSKNFRSREEILDGINDVFKTIMSKKVGECDYTKEEYLVYGDLYDKSLDLDYRPEFNIIETEKITDDLDEDEVSDEIEEISDLQKEATEIANKINSIIKSGMVVYDLKSKEYRKAEYRDIVILLRSATNKANIYEEVLKNSNIPAFCDTADSFYNGEEVSVILSLLKIVDNIYDDISLVSVMYSIIGSFTPDELVYIRQYDRKSYFYDSIIKAFNDEKNKGTEIYNKIKRLIEIIDKLKVYLNTYTIAETILKIYDDTGIYYSFYLEELGKQKCANLDSLVELAKRFEKEEKASLYEFICYIESMKEKKVKGSDTPKLLGEGENVVRILTIHKSKGLEYPIVFLANAAKKYNILDANGDVLLDKDYGIGVDIYNNDLRISYPSIIKLAIKGKIKSRTLSEEERLLYVAMTRAKEKLYIYGTVKDYDKFESKLLVPKSSKLSPVITKDCNSYLKLLMLAALFGDLKSINVNVIKYGENAQNVLSNSNAEIDREESIREKFLKLCKKNNINKIENKKYAFDEKYKYSDFADIKKKYSVTEIKDGDTNAYSLTHDDINISLEEIRPKYIDNDDVSNMNYGTIIHSILENIDYKNIDRKKIYKDIEEKFSDIKNVSTKYVKEKIDRYLNSDIAVKAIKAKKVDKEKPFVIYDDLSNVQDYALKENTYIQGVIDLIITTKSHKKIIVDFKTDRVDDEKELIERYKLQLEVYKKGVELSTNTTDCETYIYSFYLDKPIKVDI